MDIISWILANANTSNVLEGMGAIKGKNCTITSITPIDGGNRITFSWTLDDGTAKTQTLDVMDGKDGADGLNGTNGKDGLDGEKGDIGVGISKIEKISTVDLVDTYEITLTDNTTFEFTVTNGKDGESGASDWADVENKPFETLDSSTLEIDENGVLKVVGGGTGELPDMSDYYKKTETYSQLEVDNLIPDTSGFATEEYVTDAIKDKADKTDVPSVDGLISEEKLTETLADYAKTTDLPDSYDDTALSDRVTANEEAITILSGSGEGSVTKTVDNALNKFATDISNDGVVNTYKELVDYAASHSSDVAEMVAEIADNTTAIEGLDTKTTTLETSLENKVEKEEGKGLFSGKYEDLTGTPTIPSIEGLATEEVLKEHVDNVDIHVSEDDRTNWDGKAKVVEITSEDYENLSIEEKNDGTVYCISDAVILGNEYVVENVVTEGSEKLITSGAVYNEVDKINGNIITRTHEAIISVNSKETTWFNYAVPNGYTPIAISCTHLWFNCSLSYDGYIYVYNQDGIAYLNEPITVRVTYIKNELVSAV